MKAITLLDDGKAVVLQFQAVLNQEERQQVHEELEGRFPGERVCVYFRDAAKAYTLVVASTL